jgi:hypothetical protein
MKGCLLKSLPWYLIAYNWQSEFAVLVCLPSILCQRFACISNGGLNAISWFCVRSNQMYFTKAHLQELDVWTSASGCYLL